jgi:hypothetical protein
MASWHEARLAFGEERLTASQKHATKALSLAKDLQEFNKPQAAWISVNALQLLGAITKPPSPKELLDLFNVGLEEGRAQDDPWRIRLLTERAMLHLRAKAYKDAYADAMKCLELAKPYKNKIEEETLGAGHGVAGEAKYFQDPKSAEVIPQLRLGVKLAPKHLQSRNWRLYLAFVLINKYQVDGGPASLLTEASAALDAAAEGLPETATGIQNFIRQERERIRSLREKAG